jgi:cytochrome o ubiquinol oxidase subunit 2
MRSMGKIKFILGLLAFVIFALGIYFVLSSEDALLTHPKGLIARDELRLIVTHVLLMLAVVVPTMILLFVVAWKYRAKQGKQDPGHTHPPIRQWVLWLIPVIIVIPMAIITWDATHKLDPYQPIESEVKPLKIQVIALDWKWLFLYPEQGIATLNGVQFPEKTPIHFELCADGAPMNAFWIPELGSQIYAMAGMATSLHLIADEPGIYSGRASEINGEGLADMTFFAKALPLADFNAWVETVKQSPLQLTQEVYQTLTPRSINTSVLHYSFVEEGLFNKTVEKYMRP